jgi:hypothetical protein
MGFPALGGFIVFNFQIAKLAVHHCCLRII